jgi:hypothetical protein
MRKFTENKPLLASIDSNDTDEIRRILIDNIFFLQGDQNEINRAVEYSMNNSDFTFEDHRALEVSNKNNKEDYFSDEKWNMGENYSRDRYNLLVHLYQENFAEKEYTYETDSNPENNELLNKIVIGGVVIIAGYLIYKALN